MHEMTQHYLICALWSSLDNSDEQVEESIRANEYEFTEDGEVA